MPVLDELGYVLGHELVDGRNGLVHDLLCRGGNVQEERWVCSGCQCLVRVPGALCRDRGTRFLLELLLRLTLCEHVSVALVVDLDIVSEFGIVEVRLLCVAWGRWRASIGTSRGRCRRRGTILRSNLGGHSSRSYSREK